MEQTINGHTKREAMELAFKLGFDSEYNLFSCSQSTFHAITMVLGYRNGQLFKALSPFENGGADTGLNSCGAFSGALAVFGLFFGRDYGIGQRVQISLKGPRLGEKLLDRFLDAYGSAICKDIQTRCLGFSTRFLRDAKFDQAAFEKFEAAGGHKIVAPTVVGRAAYWAVDIIWAELPTDQDLSGIPSKEDAETEFVKLCKSC